MIGKNLIEGMIDSSAPLVSNVGSAEYFIILLIVFMIDDLIITIIIKRNHVGVLLAH